MALTKEITYDYEIRGIGNNIQQRQKTTIVEDEPSPDPGGASQKVDRCNDMLSPLLKFLIIYLVLLSIILEILHTFIPARSFEFPDLFGNFLGVLIILIINLFYKKYENL